LSNISIVRKIPVSNTNEITEGLITCHNKEIRKLNSSGKHNFQGNSIKKDEKDVACSAHGKHDIHKNFQTVNLKAVRNVGDPGVEGMIILE
jgi:hypothetical protein